MGDQGIFEFEVKKFCEAALTSGHIKKSEDIQLLSEFPNTLMNMLVKKCGGDIIYIERTEEEMQAHLEAVRIEKENLLREMDAMIEKGLPILEKLNGLEVPDVFDQLKSYEE